jgi:hypothetical protein
MNLAPIVLFVYNRPWHTEQTLNALMENELAADSVLFIYADGAKENASETIVKNIQETRAVIRKKKWCKEVHIIESGTNKGLASSIIQGVTDILSTFDRIIVLEDDLLTAQGFLKFINEGLNRFSTNKQVMQISGYCFPADHLLKNHASFFLPITTSWGWGCWKRAWDQFDVNAEGYMQLKINKDLEKKFNLDNAYPFSNMLINQMESKNVDSWAIRFWWSFLKNNGVALFPDRSLVKNIGFGEAATHTSGDDPYPIENFDVHYRINEFPADTTIHRDYFEQIKNYIHKVYIGHSPQKIKKVNFIKRVINKLLH